MKADGVGSDAKTRKPDDAGVPTYPAQYRARRLGTETRSARTVFTCFFSFLILERISSQKNLETKNGTVVPLTEGGQLCRQSQCGRTVFRRPDINKS